MGALLSRRIRFALIGTLFVLMAMGVLGYRAVSAFYETSGWVLHTQNMRLQIEQALSSLTEAEAASRGFAASGNEAFLVSFEPAIATVRRHLAELRRLTADNPEQQQRLNALEPQVEARITELRRIIALARAAGVATAAAEIGRGVGRDLMLAVHG